MTELSRIISVGLSINEPIGSIVSFDGSANLSGAGTVLALDQIGWAGIAAS